MRALVLAAGPSWLNCEVTRNGNGSATLRIQMPGKIDEGEATLRVEEVSLEFDSLEQALERVGTSGITSGGVIVTVRLDGEERVG